MFILFVLLCVLFYFIVIFILSFIFILGVVVLDCVHCHSHVLLFLFLL